MYLRKDENGWKFEVTDFDFWWLILITLIILSVLGAFK
jgi:hypothetical protein